MSNPAPITLEQLFRYYRGLPHQRAAIPLMEADLRNNGYVTAMRRDRPWFAVWSQAGKQADPEISEWLPLARKLVQEFEGCKLTAYPDPATGGEPWTIGWGSTRIGGRTIRPNEAITQSQADAQLDLDLLRFHEGVVALLPMAADWPAHRQAALTSFAYNVGTGALESSTLRQRLSKGEDPDAVIAAELPRWISPTTPHVIAGLQRRRNAEISLFSGAPAKPQAPAQPAKPTRPNVLRLDGVPYFSQNDNASGTGYRECFSSSCAMVAAYFKLIDSDDAYNKVRARYGDTTDPQAQVQALRSLGLEARLVTNASSGLIETLLREGTPVPVGWLHKGPIDAPTGGGHWSVITGYDTANWIHNDPNGEADMVNGGYVNHKRGAAIAYSKRNFNRRWEVPTPGNGWLLHIRRPKG